MWSYKKMLVPLLSFAFVNPCSAVDEWMERFIVERRAAFGPVRRHSVDEVKRFLILEGKPKRASVEKPTVEEEPVPLPPSAAPVRKKRKKVSKPKAPVDFPVEELLAKSRAAYESGQWESARRFYKLVHKVDPASREAEERLASIDKELR